MRYILFFYIILLCINISSADYTIGGGGSLWSENSTFVNVTEKQANDTVILDWIPNNDMHHYTLDEGSGTTIHDENVSIDGTLVNSPVWGNGYIDFELDNDQYIELGSTISISDNTPWTIVTKIRPESVTWVSIYGNLFTSGNYTRLFYYDTFGSFRIYNDGNLYVQWHVAPNLAEDIEIALVCDGTSTNNTELFINRTSYGTQTLGDTSQNISKIASIGSTTDYCLDGYMYYFRVFSTNLSLDSINNTHDETHYTEGNVTTWYDAGSGYETYELWFNFTSVLNHTDYYRDNVTGSYVLLGANQVDNKSYSLSTKYQNTDARTTLHGNTTETPELISITFKTQASVGSVDITYYNLDFDNPINVYINISNKTGVLNYINLTHIGNLSSVYCLNFPNGTAVQACVTCTGEGDIIWFNGLADRLPELDGYFINETLGVGTSTIIIPINSYGMFNNWTVATNFSNIAANESNDVCYTYYNVTTGEWDSHYVGYSWNDDYVIPLEASVFIFVDAETTVTATIITPANTSMYEWNMLFVEGTDNETIGDIIIDMEASL